MLDSEKFCCLLVSAWFIGKKNLKKVAQKFGCVAERHYLCSTKIKQTTNQNNNTMVKYPEAHRGIHTWNDAHGERISRIYDLLEEAHERCIAEYESLEEDNKRSHSYEGDMKIIYELEDQIATIFRMATKEEAIYFSAYGEEVRKTKDTNKYYIINENI